MKKLITPEGVAQCITALIARNKLWAGKRVSISFIVNKAAGCFTNKKKAARYGQLFESELAAALGSGAPECTASISYKILATRYSGHARELALGLVAETVALGDTGLESVIVTCGGDGTSLEVQETLFKEAQADQKKKDAVMNRITLLRLPLGTGNDGTDGHSIPEVFEILKSQLVYTNSPAIKVYPEKMPSDEEIKKSALADGKKIERYGNVEYKAPWYGFNIVSIGLDAYVVYLSNAFKKRIPGEVYHLAVPFSALLFNKSFKPGTARIEFFDDNDNIIDEVNSKITLFAFGASGHRVYGGGHKVLPDNRNICFTKLVGLFTIIKESKKYAKGLHFSKGISEAFSAKKVRISYDQPILLQCDGESTIITKAQFPLIIEKTEPCVRVLTRV